MPVPSNKNRRLKMKIGIISCSDGIKNTEKQTGKYRELISFLEGLDIEIERAATIFRKENHIYSGKPKERAVWLNRLFADSEISYIFDLSGGDSGNEILEYLDYDIIKNSKAIYCGYSDLSTVINAIYTKSEKKSYYYNIWNLLSDKNGKEQKKWFKEVFIEGKYSKEKLKIEYGDWIDGEILGGNLRCFSKVIGTEYMPDFTGKNILIEAWSGDEARFRTYLYQMKHAGIFKKVKGVILGTFTELEKEKSCEYIYNMAKDITEVENIVKLSNIGHNSDSYTILIG
jgi:muramoyltetrapeptide carboxypeptidase